MAGRDGQTPGAARLHLADGVALLRPEEQVVEAMLDGWRNQQLARNLALSTTEANRGQLGGSKDAKGQAAGFPQARVVMLTETGTHAQIDAAAGGFNTGEPELAIRLVASALGMLVIMDRGFPGVALWRAYTEAGAHLLIRARSCVAARPIEYLPEGTYLARMNLAGQKRAALGHVVLRVVEYRVDGGEVIRLLTDLLDPDAYPADELAGLYRQRWEAESSYPQIKTFQRGPQEVLRLATPSLVQQEVWAHLIVHHCLTRIIMELAEGEKIDPDRISFLKVLKHVRRSVIGQTANTARKIKLFMGMLASKVRRKLDSGPRRPREADRLLKRPDSKYSFRQKGRVRRPTRRTTTKVIALHPRQ